MMQEVLQSQPLTEVYLLLLAIMLRGRIPLHCVHGYFDRSHQADVRHEIKSGKQHMRRAER